MPWYVKNNWKAENKSIIKLFEEKNVRRSRGSNPGPLAYRASALPTEPPQRGTHPALQTNLYDNQRLMALLDNRSIEQGRECTILDIHGVWALSSWVQHANGICWMRTFVTNLLHNHFVQSFCLKIILYQNNLLVQQTNIVNQIHHTRLCLGCSSLNFDLHCKNLVVSPLCTCGVIEMIKHFLNECHLYLVQRNKYISNLDCKLILKQ